MKMNSNFGKINNAVEESKKFLTAVARRLVSLTPYLVKGEDGRVIRKEIKFTDCGDIEAPVIPSWLAKAPVDEIRARFQKQADFRVLYTKELEKLGFIAKVNELSNGQKEYGVEKDNKFYTYSAINDVDENGKVIYNSQKYPLVSDWVESNIDDLDHPVRKALQDYLGSFWAAESFFWDKLGGKDNVAVEIPKGMTLEEARQWYRFKMTISDLNKAVSQFFSDYKLLKGIMSNTPLSELRREGLVEDTRTLDDRTKESKEKSEFFDQLSKEDFIMWTLTRRVAKFISRYDSYIYETWDTKNYKHFESWETIAWTLKSMYGEEKRDANGSIVMGENPKTGEMEPKRINMWTVLEVLLPYYITGAVGCGDLANAFYTYSEKAALFHTPEEQAEYQFVNWAKKRLESMKKWVNGSEENEPHPEYSSMLHDFEARLIEDEVI